MAGKPPINGTLEFVAVMIRHGDRGPLRPIRNLSDIDCGTPRTPLLQKYLETLKYLNGSTKHMPVFSLFPLQPEEKTCTTRLMTLLGAHQLLMVGQTLHKAYIENHGLLSKNWTPEHVKLYSTVFPRTFQSAVAFLFTFLPTFNISNITIIPSVNDKFCMSDYYCRCPLIDYLERFKMLKERKLMTAHPAVFRLIQKLNPIIKHHPKYLDIFDPFMMVDSLMGYMCHGSQLPCIPGTNECVTLEHVRNLFGYIEWIKRQFMKDSSNSKAGMLTIYGFLNHLLSNMNAYISGKEPSRFILYSGHDITLEPLSAALGIEDGILIPYASRIVFELYSHSVNNKLKYILKILYNGKDVTKNTTFCKSFFKESLKSSNPSDYGICPFESFKKFFEEWVSSVGASSFQALCNYAQFGSSPFNSAFSSYDYESYKE